MSGSFAATAVVCVAIACLAMAALTDLRHRIIPNTLVLAVMIAGLALRSLSGPRPLLFSVLVCAAVIFVLGVLASYRLLGWGDVKLISVATLLLPVNETMPLLAAIAIAGGIMALLYLSARRLLTNPRHAAPSGSGGPIAPHAQHGLAGVLHRESLRIRGHEAMPYAVAVLGGVTYQIAMESVRCWPATLCWS